MPTYQYRCNHCGHEFEVFQSITAEPLKQCPECGGNGVQRLIGAGAGIIFKGSGFYATDYRGTSSGGSSSAGGKDSESADSEDPDD